MEIEFIGGSLNELDARVMTSKNNPSMGKCPFCNPSEGITAIVEGGPYEAKWYRITCLTCRRMGPKRSDINEAMLDVPVK